MNKTAKIDVRVTPELKRKLTLVAKSQGRTLGGLIAFVMEKYAAKPKG